MNNKHDENCGCNHELEHDDHCGCGCDDEMDLIYLTLDDDTELECNVLGTFEVDDYEYIALVPVDDDQVFLYRYEEDEEGIDLIDIEDDEEFEIVSDAFYTLFVEEDLDFDDEDYEEDLYDDFDDED